MESAEGVQLGELFIDRPSHYVERFPMEGVSVEECMAWGRMGLIAGA